MSYFSDRQSIVVDGERIDVEAKVGWSGGSEFSLIVGGRRIDKVKGSPYGDARLHGSLADGRTLSIVTKPSKARAGLSGSVLAGMKYDLEIAGSTAPLGSKDAPPEFSTGRNAGGTPSSAGQVHDALRELDQLREDRLVTDDEYAEKRREILGRL